MLMWVNRLWACNAQTENGTLHSKRERDVKSDHSGNQEHYCGKRWKWHSEKRTFNHWEFIEMCQPEAAVKMPLDPVLSSHEYNDIYHSFTEGMKNQ